MSTTHHEPGRSVDGLADESIGGASIFLAGAIAFMGIVTAEVLYPAYSTRQDISDLGSTLPPDPIVLQPSSAIFNWTMQVTGALIVVGAYFVHRAWRRRSVTVPLGGFGLAVFGVGLFPGYLMPWHGLAAMVAFFGGGITLLTASRVVSRPFSTLSVVLGAISLLVLASAIVLDTSHPLLVLGRGGVER